MLRAVLSVLLGYVALFVFVMVTYTLLWLVIGQDAAFQAGTTQVTGTWLALALPLSFAAAVLGGIVAVTVARERGFAAMIGLAALVFVLGIGSALGGLGAEGEGPAAASPRAEMSAFEAAAAARQPDWVAWILPFLGAAGVLVGGATVRRRRAEVTPATTAP